MKDLIGCWVSMKGERERIRVRWRQRGRTGHGVVPSCGYLKYNIPTFRTKFWVHWNLESNYFGGSGNFPHVIT